MCHSAAVAVVGSGGVCRCSGVDEPDEVHDARDFDHATLFVQPPPKSGDGTVSPGVGRGQCKHCVAPGRQLSVKFSKLSCCDLAQLLARGPKEHIQIEGVGRVFRELNC